MPRVLLIIVTYQAEAWLDTCMASAAALREVADVAVVDNASTDSTRHRLDTQYRHLITHYFPLTKNLGFGKAHNVVFSQSFAAAYDYYFLLNQDAEIAGAAFAKLITTAEQHPEYGILSPLQYRDEHQLDVRFERYLATGTGEQRAVIEVDFVNAAVWLLRRSVVERIGYFNPIFPHYGEDINYLERAKLAGYRVGIVPGIRAYHYRSPDPIPERLETPPYGMWITGLLRMVDPTKTLNKALLQTGYDYLRLCAQLMMMGKWKLAGTHLSYALRLLRDVPQYANHRKLVVSDSGLDGTETMRS